MIFYALRLFSATSEYLKECIDVRNNKDKL